MNKANHLLEYFSLTLILSYFFFHNIYLVFIGIPLSFYLLNIKIINSFIRTINKTLGIEKLSKKCYDKDSSTKADCIQIKSTKDDSSLTLVETIEELGFIPSADKIDNNKAA